MFVLRDLSHIAYLDGCEAWWYKSGTDTLETITSPGYFEAAKDKLVCGDYMMINAADKCGLRIVADDNYTLVVKS